METSANPAGRAFCLFDNIDIADPAKLEEYKEKVFPVVQVFGGRYIVASDKIRQLEGNWRPRYLVMIEFPSFELASQWYDSEQYRELKNLRQSSGAFDGIIMQGI